MQLTRMITWALTMVLACSSATAASTGNVVSEPFSMKAIGESRHWVVILTADGQFQDGRLEDLHVRPWIIWAGGGDTPEQYVTMFTLQNATCGRGGHSKGPKLQVSAACKLVSSGQPSLAVHTPEELMKLVVTEGSFTVEWRGKQETVPFR